MPWGTSASNTLKINKITIISFFTLCRNTTISFHNFVELIPVFKIYLYLCRIYNPQIEMFARFKTKSSFHKTKRII